MLKRVEKKFEIHNYDVMVGNTLKNVLEELGGYHDSSSEWETVIARSTGPSDLRGH